MAESVAEYLLQHFREHLRERACRQRRGYRTESFTYGDTLEMAYGFAGELEARGIVKGDRVIVWGKNCAEWVAVFFGCLLRGVVVVPMDDGSAVDFVGRVAAQVEAKLLVGSRRHAPECASAGFSVASLAWEDLEIRC